MREIKFRAWEKPLQDGWNGVMHDWKWVRELEFPFLPPTDPAKFSSHGLFYDDGYVFMQFTGLRDKNGREIYEGDFLKQDTTANIWEMRWNSYGFLLSSVFPLNRKLDKELDKFPGLAIHMEVIGNIYENPELLNV